MRRIKVVFLALVAMCVLGSMVATSAFAAGPTLLFLGSEGPTVLLVTSTSEPSNTTPTELQSSVATIKGTGVLLELTLLQTPSGPTGIYLALFLETELSGTKCNTKGDASGEILLPNNTAELVYSSTSPLAVGILFNVASFKIECGTFKLSVAGSDLGSVEPINKEVEGAKSVEGSVTCSSTKGKPSKENYTNSKGEAKKAKLTTTASEKESESCELIGTTETSKEALTPNKMVEVMG